MTTFATPLALAKKLIALSSYVDSSHDETPALDYLTVYLASAFPEMSLEKQYIAGSSRYNLLLKGKKPTKLLVLGHIDTVQPKEGWLTDPLTPTTIEDKLYGLGAADMKSSLAAFLWALEAEQLNGREATAVLIYVDEEYDFKGMKRFLDDKVIKEHSPEMILSLDGELAVGTGCRGLIELSLTIKGKSGHASNPANGINAITGSIAALGEVSSALSRFEDPDLGSTTSNIAAIRGGVVQQDDNGTIEWFEEGNVIPDTAEIVLEIRTALPEVTAALVTKTVEDCLRQQSLTLHAAKVRHDIAPWPVQRDPQVTGVLQAAYDAAGVPLQLSERKLQGYIDAQMVVEQIPSPTFIIGTGGVNKHGANEHVPLQNIEDAAKVYRALINCYSAHTGV